MFKLIGVYCVLAFAVQIITADKYITEHPSYIKPCEIKKPGFTACSTESVQGIFNQFNLGIPGLENIKIDPFSINKIKIDQPGRESANINMEISKITITGFKDTIIKESQVSPEDFSWKTTLFLPKMELSGDYALEGRILLIPLNSKGKINVEITGMTLICYTTTTLYQKGGLIFYNVTDEKVDYTFKGIKLNLSNLFNGNKELEDSTNELFNQNWEVLSEALKPIITKTIEEILLEFLQKVFHFIPGQFLVTDLPTPDELYGKN